MAHPTEEQQLREWMGKRGGEMIVDRYPQDPSGKSLPAYVTVHDERDGVIYSAELEPTSTLTERLKAALKAAKEPKPETITAAAEQTGG